MTKFTNCHPICFAIFISVAIINQINGAVLRDDRGPVLNVAVIGAGTAGLASAKYSLAHGYNVTIFEQTEKIGGAWVYTNKTGKDQYGVNIHSAMYQGLRTNSPRIVMSYPDHPYPKDTIPFPPSGDVLKYLQSYADRFDLKKYIKFTHLVVRVLPIENGKWEVIVKDLPNNKFKTLIYDVVFVCSGHFSTPRYPDIPNINMYKGKLIHSHDFRTADAFRGDSVLIIGGGPSGIDLVQHLTKIATRITFSQHKIVNETNDKHSKRQSVLPTNVLLQDDVVTFTPTGALFFDGTHQTFSAVIFATGYKFTYPFLSVDTGINVDDNFIQPLYKQVINIEHPTMIFIGIPYNACHTRLYDLQVRFAMKLITGAKVLPSKWEMLTDMQTKYQKLWIKGARKRYVHNLGSEQKQYYHELANTADIDGIPDVLADIHVDSDEILESAPFEFRKYKYTVIDDKTFIREKYEK